MSERNHVVREANMDPEAMEEKTDDQARHFHFLLMQTFKHVDRLIHERTAKLNLDPGQPKILQCLYEGHGKTPKQIGQWCVLDKSTITTLLKLME